MCGIAGYITFNNHDPQKERLRIQRMTKALAHRGPDADGFYLDTKAALGHRRLCVIDRSGGKQPMELVAKDRLIIVYNGEVYNFIEIREELKTKGHRFNTQSDTEVILVAYLEWGKDCVKKFNGMFAFAIWNVDNNTLFLGRDRVGKKPLFYGFNGKTFSFASELKALLAGGFCTDEINLNALDCYFCFGYIPASEVIFKGVQKLPAAHTLTVTEKGIQKDRYWLLTCGNRKYRSIEEATEDFEELLDKAVDCRMMSEVPLGAFLSGGIDSALIVSSMAKCINNKVLTNTIGFEDEKFNEIPTARAVADHFHCDHREFVVKPNVAGILHKIAWHFDEPFADSSSVPTWYLCQMAKQNVTVVLSGDGGDESFGGYTFRYLPHLLESKIRSVFPSSIRSLIFGSIGAIYPASSKLPKPLRLKTIFKNLAVDDCEAFMRDLVWLLPEERNKFYSSDFLHALHGFTPFMAVAPYYIENDALSAMAKAQYADINFYMTDDVLVKVDRMSMAHSLEVRSPLLDYRILEFAAGLPDKYKLNRSKGKLVLRRLAEKRCPPQVNRQPKLGFSIPAADWLRKELKDIVEESLGSKNSIIWSIFKKRELDRAWSRHLTGQKDYNVFLWGLIMLYMWEKAYNIKA